VSTYT